MTDAQGSDVTGAWQETITFVESALRGDGVPRAQVEAAIDRLCVRQLPDRPSAGGDVAYLVSLLDFLGLYDMSRKLLEHVDSCFSQNPGVLNLDAAVRNQLAVTFAERGQLTAAETLLTGAVEDGRWTAAVLANQACVMLRRDDLEGAAHAATRARRAALLAESNDETEESLDVQVLATAVLAEVIRRVNQHTEADQLVDELEGFVRRLAHLLGDSHPKSISALATLASAEFESAKAAGDHERMERVCDVIALAAQRMSAILGTEHPRSLSILQNLATVEYETARALGGDRRLRRANALLTAAVQRADALRRWDPRSLDLDEAVQVGRAAVATTPSGHPARPAHLARLGNALQGRFQHTGAAEDLDEAIELARAAVATAPNDHPGRAAHLARLGNALQARFQHTGAAQDLFEAIEVGRSVVTTTPDDPVVSAGLEIAMKWGAALGGPEQLKVAFAALEPQLKREHQIRLRQLEAQKQTAERQARDEVRQYRFRMTSLIVGAVIGIAMLGAGVYVARDAWWLATLLCGPSVLALAKIIVLRRSDASDLSAAAAATKASPSQAQPPP